MSDKNLRLQVVLSAVDKLTRPFKEARASTKELGCRRQSVPRRAEISTTPEQN
jgi:hypothetical protein